MTNNDTPPAPDAGPPTTLLELLRDVEAEIARLGRPGRCRESRRSRRRLAAFGVGYTVLAAWAYASGVL